MKYRALLTGNNQQLISDFFFQNEGRLECLTSSMRNEDIVRHIKYFKPDTLIFCLQNETSNSNRAMFDVKDACTRNNIVVSVIGTTGECDLFKRNSPGMTDITLFKPVEARQASRTICDKINEIKRSSLNVPNVSQSGNEEVSLDEDFNINSISDLDKLMSGSGLSGMDGSAIDMSGADALAAAKKKHILVVDDDKGVLKMIKSILSDDYDVATAVSGKVAMKFLDSKTTDLILLDYNMPVQTGPEVLEAIRENPKTKDLPVIFLTGVSESGKIKDVLAMKPQGYLLKPINMGKLLGAIKDVIG